MTIAPGILLPEVEIADICTRYEVRELSIFGSVLRGEVGPNSDIDFLVDFLAGAEISLFRHAAAERELSALLGRKVDLASKRALRDGHRDEVLSQARLVYAA
jgi:predicted nucleotidyltransferase